MKVFSNTNYASFDKFVSYELSFSTADIETMLFYDDSSPEPAHFEADKPIVEYKIIGDELMRVDRNNFPPGTVIQPE